MIGLFDAGGNTVVQYVYNSWGMPVSTTGMKASTVGAINPFRYRGYVYDTESGLYYLQSRYYNPEWGRFVNGDNIVPKIPDTMQDYTIYAYCDNDSVNRIDPTGHYDIGSPVTAQMVSNFIVGLGISGFVDDRTIYIREALNYYGIPCGSYNTAGGQESRVAARANRRNAEAQQRYMTENTDYKARTSSPINTKPNNTKPKSAKSPKKKYYKNDFNYSKIMDEKFEEILPGYVPELSYGDEEWYARQSTRQYYDENNYIRLYP